MPITPLPATQSLFPADASWVGVMLLVIAGLFLAALVIGIAARALAPERYEDADLPPKVR